MTTATHVLSDLEAKAAQGHPLTAEDAARVFGTVDLVSIGVVGEASRRAVSGETVTFGRVLQLRPGDPQPTGAGPDASVFDAAGEVRIAGLPSSVDQAVDWVRDANAAGATRCLTGFTLDVMWRLAGESPAGLTQTARRLADAGLHAVAEWPVDRFGDLDLATVAIESLARGGLEVWRATVHEATASARLALILRASDLQRRVSSLRAFAPLPRLDPAGEPSTGYDDVRTVSVARAVCTNIPHIQVDWPIYGPKLAQVAIAFGANDIDGVDVVDRPELGPRRTAVEDISRQIRAASAVPAERDGRYERRQ